MIPRSTATRATSSSRARVTGRFTSFVAMRRERDATLAMPALIAPSVQVNIRAGNLPPTFD